MTSHPPVIDVDHLRKTYGSVTAVEDLSFDVDQGEIFGMVGPNGAGKTTVVECIEGLRPPTSGHIRTLTLDPFKNRYELRARIGVQLQESALQPRLKVWEALDLYASFYSHPLDWRDLLKDIGLEDKYNTYFSNLSGGQKQRLFIALALLNDPELVFLDELTTGLDPQARHAMWDLVQLMRRRGKTIFLITHFMEEAERLCDRVAIVEHGRIVALDSPANLIHNLKAENRIVFMFEGFHDLESLRNLQGVSQVTQDGNQVTVTGSGGTLLANVINTLDRSGVQYRDVNTVQPTLEDVYLKLTGHTLRD
jgi:ABC-2 type transport system ATP-binding protein